MANYAKDTGPRTTVWKNSSSGKALVKTLHGLPYGTAKTIIIDCFGEAYLSGIQRSGSGGASSIVEVEYTLK